MKYDELKVIEKLENIPHDATVTKIRGEQAHTVKRETLKVYRHNGKLLEIPLEGNCAALVSETGGITIYPNHKEFVWYTDMEELNRLNTTEEEKYSQ